MKLYDLFGWVGVLLILSAYGLITFGVVEAEDWVYNVLNLFGAAGILWSSYKKKDFQPVTLNIVWLTIAIIGLVRALL